MEHYRFEAALCALIPSVLLILFVKLNPHFHRQHYPPGPSPKGWITGNLCDIPREKPWLKFTEWASLYGDITHFRVLHQHFIVLNTVEAANNLLEKRSSIYSDKVLLPMAQMMGLEFATPLKPYGKSWKAHQRILKRIFQSEVSRRHHDVQMRKIYDMVHQLLSDSENFLTHIRHASGAVVMSLVYDYDVEPKADPYIKVIKEAVDNIGVALLPGWFPGAGFSRFAQHTKYLIDQSLDQPLDLVQQRMGAHQIRACMATELLEDCQSQDEFNTIKEVCATVYGAGADTTASAVETFFYVMALRYDIQLKAQEEIDHIIGRDRLPTFEDRVSLPYTEALCREVFRWRPIVPLGAARCMMKDDIYQGYTIPKGAIVFPDVWGMTRDKTKYEDPETFNPSRFLTEDGRLNGDDVHYTFGFGRRICPGRHLALATVWLSVVTVLAVFDIRKKRDSAGLEIPLPMEYGGPLVLHPPPFECSITPRSESAKTHILDAIGQRD